MAKTVKKTKKTKTKIGSGKPAKTVKDELVEELAESLNSEFKKQYKVAYFLDGTSDIPSDITDFVSTGCDELDLRISNRKNGGYPVGRIVEITGLESTGKSLLAAHALAETQKRNGVAVFMDTESAISEEFLRAIGVQLDGDNKLIYTQPETIEDVFTAMEIIINSVRESTKNRLVTIVVDSVMGAPTKAEIEGNYEKEGYGTQKAITMSKAMRKITNLIAKQKILVIFTNQLRQKLNVMFGDQYTTSGGKALAFHSSVRLRLKSTGKLKVSDDVVGISVVADVIKNRVGPPFRKSKFDILFASGIDNYGSWLKTLKDYTIIKGTKAKYTYKSETGKEYEFTSAKFVDLMKTDDELHSELYNKFADKCIMKYGGDTTIGIDDTETESATIED